MPHIYIYIYIYISDDHDIKSYQVKHNYGRFMLCYTLCLVCFSDDKEGCRSKDCLSGLWTDEGQDEDGSADSAGDTRETGRHPTEVGGAQRSRLRPLVLSYWV